MQVVGAFESINMICLRKWTLSSCLSLILNPQRARICRVLLIEYTPGGR